MAIPLMVRIVSGIPDEAGAYTHAYLQGLWSQAPAERVAAVGLQAGEVGRK